MSSLFVSPHPDDVEIGCGGLIHRLCKNLQHTAVAVCTGHGNVKMVHSGQTVSFDERREEQVAALHCLGSPDVFWLNLASAPHFDTVPRAVFVSAFDDLFVKFNEVYIPLPTYNVDHEIVWKAAMAAFRAGRLERVNLFAYEQPAQGHGQHQPRGLIQAKRYYVLDQADIDAKLRSISAHVSQMIGREDTINGPYGAQLLAHQRGLDIGEEYAEVVYPVKEVVLI